MSRSLGSDAPRKREDEMKNEDEDRLVQVYARVPRTKSKALRQHALDHDTTVQALLADAIERIIGGTRAKRSA